MNRTNFQRISLFLLLNLLIAMGASAQSENEKYANAKTQNVRVTSRTVFFKPEQLINELSKRNETKDWGWKFVDKPESADINIELDHTLFTYKFSFKAVDSKGIILATGNVIIFDGNLGAGKMANRVI